MVRLKPSLGLKIHNLYGSRYQFEFDRSICVNHLALQVKGHGPCMGWLANSRRGSCHDGERKDCRARKPHHLRTWMGRIREAFIGQAYGGWSNDLRGHELLRAEC